MINPVDQIITEEDLATLDKEFSEVILVDPERSEVMVQQLHEFFDNAPQRDWRFRMSYFRWYTQLMWQRLNCFPKELVIDVAMARQVPMALLLDFDVWTSLMWFLGKFISDEVELRGNYEKMKSRFLSSQANLGSEQEKEITVEQMVSELKKTRRPNTTSLEKASLLARIKGILFPKNDNLFYTYIKTEPDTVVDRFIDLVDFFLEVDSADIPNVVDTFVFPERYGLVTFASPPALSSSQPSSNKTSVHPVPNRNPEMPKSVPAKLALADIRLLVLKKYPEQPGQAQNVEGVMQMLDELATKYNNPQIRELYYFDQTDGEFKWNEKLLGEK